MQERDIALIQKILGDDFLEKSEIGSGIYKLNTNTTIDPEEIKIALQIVPRSILTYLFMNLKHKQIGEVINLELPFADATLNINKLSADNYSGEIYKDGKRLSIFKYRSLPGVGLILMSTLELYDINQLNEIKTSEYESPKTEKIQELIEERLRLQNLISSVVDKKLSEREAIKELIKDRINKELPNLLRIPIKENANECNDKEEINEMCSKKSKLKEFLESREKKRQEPIEFDKNEINCPDCNTNLYKNGDKSLRLCICYGQYHNKHIKIEKSGNRVRLKFPKTFDIDNIEMLIDALKNQ